MGVAVVVLFLVVVMAGYYLIVKGDKAFTPKQKAGLKIVPTSLCALLALYGAATGGKAAFWFLFLGLCVCATADWLLEFEFIKGMATFGVGHILYCIGYVLAGPVHWRSLIIFIVLFGAVFFLYTRLKSKLDQAPLYLCYAFVLCCMAALASSRQSFLMVGGFLFVISDCMIGIGVATQNRKRWYDIAILVTYYAAQFLIALSTVAP